MGARCWLTRTQVHYAELLLRSSRLPTDRTYALALLGEALERARHLGMEGLAQSAQDLLERSQPPPAKSVSPARPSEDQALFRRSGDVWQIEYAGSSCQLRDTRGLRYIAQLLHHPGRQFHVAELVQLASPPDREAGASFDPDVGDHRVAADLGDAGPILDSTAAATYRRPLTELREALTEAEGFSDLGRAAAVRHELDFLTTELAAAARGRGGLALRARPHRRDQRHQERPRQAPPRASGAGGK
jgi:hypothetical protein